MIRWRALAALWHIVSLAYLTEIRGPSFVVATKIPAQWVGTDKFLLMTRQDTAVYHLTVSSSPINRYQNHLHPSFLQAQINQAAARVGVWRTT
jgi:hypothetical protein